MKTVEKHTVYEVYLQLLNEPFLPGMDVFESDTFQNMTDQMMHLIGTRFRNRFGEHFYRIVISNFYPSRLSLVVRAFILLDPSEENLYFATTMWFSLAGHVTLGKYPLLPGNIEVIECQMVPNQFHSYLSDRSYRRPFDSKYATDPLLVVTLPAALGMSFSILLIMALLKLCHHLAFVQGKKDRRMAVNN